MPSESGPVGTAALGQQKVEGELQSVASTRQPSAASNEIAPGGRLNVLVLSFLSLVTITFGVWLVTSGQAYRDEYELASQGWHVGTTRRVEITLVKEDKQNLGCASNRSIGGLRCGYDGNGRAVDPASADAAAILQPFATVGHELMLGAGLWASPDLRAQLPDHRITATCVYTVTALTKSPWIRFAATDSFRPLAKSVTAGTLTYCTVLR